MNSKPRFNTAYVKVVRQYFSETVPYNAHFPGYMLSTKRGLVRIMVLLDSVYAITTLLSGFLERRQYLTNTWTDFKNGSL